MLGSTWGHWLESSIKNIGDNPVPRVSRFLDVCEKMTQMKIKRRQNKISHHRFHY